MILIIGSKHCDGFESKNVILITNHCKNVHTTIAVVIHWPHQYYINYSLLMLLLEWEYDMESERTLLVW